MICISTLLIEYPKYNKEQPRKRACCLMHHLHVDWCAKPTQNQNMYHVVSHIRKSRAKRRNFIEPQDFQYIWSNLRAWTKVLTFTKHCPIVLLRWKMSLYHFIILHEHGIGIELGTRYLPDGHFFALRFQHCGRSTSIHQEWHGDGLRCVVTFYYVSLHAHCTALGWS